jgi:signal transduction histidine kinase/CheY-like chemotaxis protein
VEGLDWRVIVMGDRDNWEFLARTGRVLGESLDYAIAIERIVRAGLYLPCDACVLCLVDDTGEIKIAAKKVAARSESPHGPADAVRTVGDDWPATDEGPAEAFLLQSARDAMRSGRCERTTVRSAIPEDGSRVLAVLSAPLLTPGTALGAVILIRSGSGADFNTDSGLCTEFGWMAAAAIGNTRLFEKALLAQAMAEQAAERNARLHAVSAAISRALTPEQVARAFLDQGARSLGAIAGWVSILKEDGLTLKLLCASGNYPGGEDPDVPAVWTGFDVHSLAPLADAIRAGRPILISNPQERRQLYPHLFRGEQEGDSKSMAAVPLTLDEKIVGGMGLLFEGPQEFGAEDLEFLRILSYDCARAMERARLYDAEQSARREAERARRQLTFLSQASAALSSSLNDCSLQDIGQLVVPEFADVCLIDLERGGGNVQRIVAHALPAKEDLARRLLDRSSSGPGSGIPATGGPASKAIPAPHSVERARLLTAITDSDLLRIAPDGEERAILTKLHLVSGVLVPLSARGRNLGLLTTYTTVDSGRLYSSADLALMEALARRVALAVDNARLYAEANEANAAKDRFLAILSHELRNPLATMMAGVEVLRGTPGVVGAAETLSAIERSIRLQAGLVDELLDLSRISQGTIRLKRAPVALDVLIRNCLKVIEAETRKVGLPIAYEPEATASSDRPGWWVDGDTDRLEQVILNLLSNAIKFTPAGGRILVRLFETIDAIGKPVARVAITDTGIGIEAELLPKLFDMFQQGEVAGRGKPGLGIGLAIARSLVELHGGRIWAESAGARTGSTFTIELPIEHETRAPGSRKPNAASEEQMLPDRAGLRLMVVEDNKDTRKLISYTLRTQGYFVQAAGSAEEALEILRGESESNAKSFTQQTVILADIGLPGINGYEFLKRARDLPGFEDAVAIAVTGWGSEKDIRRAWDAGFNAHFVKPMDAGLIDRRIRELVMAKAHA